METAQKLFERAKRLNSEGLARLVALRERHLSSGTEAKCSPDEERHAGLLAYPGLGDSDYTDVSSHKAKHSA
jgi:hypothetical protein